MRDRLISAARSAWYTVAEPVKLRLARWEHEYETWGGKPLVSVIIPTHNRADLLLHRSLPRVRAQSYRDLEIIVAAHGCTDDTCERVLKLDDERITLLMVPRLPTYPATALNHWFAGPVAPLNAALDVCRGKWIARLDDDDEWSSDHVEKLLEFAVKGNWEFVSAAIETHLGKVKPYNLDHVRVGGCQTWLYRHYLKAFRYNPDCYRKKWDKVNDTDLQWRFRNAGVRMGYLDEVVARVFPRPGEKHVGSMAYLADPERIAREMAF